MPPICDALTAGIAYDCANPPVGGANDRLILMNFAAVEAGTVTFDNANPIIVTNIALTAPALAYAYEGLNNSNEPRAAMVKGRYVNGYDHEVRFKCFDNSPAAKLQLGKLDGALVVAIVQNNRKGASGNSAFEIYGLQTGLRLQELERILADAETQGAYNLLIRNDEISRPSSLPHTLWATDFATTLAIVDGLLT